MESTPNVKKLRKFFRDYWAVTLLACFILAIVCLYLFGWRIGPSGFPVLAGTLVVSETPKETYVYVDQIRRHKVGEAGSISLFLSPGMHSVIVDAPSMQPWNELFPVVSGKRIELKPILVPKEPEGRVLEGEEQAAGLAALANTIIPTKTNPLRLSNGCALVYVAGNRVVGDATTTPSCAPPEYLLCPAEEGAERTLPCPSATGIFPQNGYLTSVVPFPGRDDALIVTTVGAAYVIELDPREPQFFAPLERAGNVKAAPWTDSAVIIRTGTRIREFSFP